MGCRKISVIGKNDFYFAANKNESAFAYRLDTSTTGESVVKNVSTKITSAYLFQEFG